MTVATLSIIVNLVHGARNVGDDGRAGLARPLAASLEACADVEVVDVRLLGGCQAAQLSMLGRRRESELLESVRVADVHLGAACDLSL